jgi:hypothetical protein
MKIYYRGYIINEDNSQHSGCTVQGMRPERKTVALEDNPRAAMRWIDRDVIRQKVEDAGWLSPRALLA